MIKKLVISSLLALSALAAAAQDQVVYHISDAKAQALAGLRNVRNHLDTEPKTQIVVVSHGEGIDFMLEGANDRNGSPYAATVAALVNRGVKFVFHGLACPLETTLPEAGPRRSSLPSSKVR